MVISIFGDEKSVIDAFAAGAGGYLLKDGSADYIGKAIVQLLSGGAPISATVAHHLIKQFNSLQQAVASESILTRRECEILEYIELGYNYQEIAEQLHLSFHTVNVTVHASYITISDNGRGMTEADYGKGHGLENMQLRARKIGAKLNINSDSSGTCVRLVFELLE